MSKRRRGKKMSEGNGTPTNNPNLVPPLSVEEFADIVGQFKKRGLPVILYVFNGTDFLDSNRILDANKHQMSAVATELDEWSRVLARQHIASLQKQMPSLAQAGPILPKDLKGQGQG